MEENSINALEQRIKSDKKALRLLKRRANTINSIKSSGLEVVAMGESIFVYGYVPGLPSRNL